jgi:acetyl coenzyme A synthetase (ADP forming)-like protein
MAKHSMLGSRKLLSEPEGYDLLTKHSIPHPRFLIAKDRTGAVKAAEKIGYPVVMKIVSPQVVHKSDVGGVVTGIANSRQAKQAYDRILRNVRKKDRKLELSGIIVQQEMPPGLELIIGGKVDASFGKIITFGLGGKLVEILRDVSIRVLPVNRAEIRMMLREIKGYRLIEGYRDEPAKDEKALVKAIFRMCRFFYEDDTLSEFDINPIILYEKGICAVDARIYAGTEVIRKSTRGRKLTGNVFNPRSIAVVGASADQKKVGYAVFRNLLDFPGDLYAVNPGRKEILNHKAYPSIASIPKKADLAVIATPATTVPKIIEDAGKKGVRLAVVISAGFREMGKEGELLEQKMLTAAEKYGVRIVGPNCLGIMLPHKKINATFDPVSPLPGAIAFISQSGATITTLVDWSIREKRGFSEVMSVGNQVDLGFDDFIDLATIDPYTKCIIMYVEEIRDGKEFMKVVGKATAKKPIIAIKSGASSLGQMAASSHTGSLAGSHEVYLAAFKQAGVITAYSLKEAFQIAELLACEGYPKGKRVLVITNAGGFSVLASDYAERYGLDVVQIPDKLLGELNTFLPADWSHENPLDLIGDAGADRYASVFDLMIKKQKMWDIAFVVAVPTAVLDPKHLAKEIIRFSKSTDKMIVSCLLGGDSLQSGINILGDICMPNFSELEEAFRVVGKVISVRN